MQKRTAILACLSACISISTAVPDGLSLRPVFSLTEMNLFSLGVMTGVDGIEIAPGVPSALLADLAGGYLMDAYWRDASGNRLSPESPGFPDRAAFWTWQARARLGASIGLLRSESLGKNVLSLDTFYKSDYRSNGNNGAFLFQGSEANRYGSWENSFFSALSLDLVEVDSRAATMRGPTCTLSAEWAPDWDWNRVFGRASYARLSLNGSVYVPLVAQGPVRLYLGERLAADALFGDEIPFDQLNRMAIGTIAWLVSYPGTGYALRGVEAGRLDSRLKIVNNLDLRLTLPDLFGRLCVPEIFVFFDAAAYGDPGYSLNYGASGLYSAGLGLYLHLIVKKFFGLDELPLLAGYAIAYCISEDRFMFSNFCLGSRYSF
jgi:hypothetical protein